MTQLTIYVIKDTYVTTFRLDNNVNVFNADYHFSLLKYTKQCLDE